jgi:hypothetical protein
MENGRPESNRAIGLQEPTRPTGSGYAPLPTRETRKSRLGTRARKRVASAHLRYIS